MDNAHGLEIRVVANGYVVSEAYNQNMGSYPSFVGFRVFETLDAAFAFMRKALSTPVDFRSQNQTGKQDE